MPERPILFDREALIACLEGDERFEALLAALDEAEEDALSFATTRTFAPARPLTSETTCSTGRSPQAFRISSRSRLRSQPEVVSGCVQTTTSSICSEAS